MNRSKTMNKLLIEHERMETPRQEKLESKQTQIQERKLGLEKKRGGKLKPKK
jgi:hypothetical protein